MLEWILKRCESKIAAQETPIGAVPNAKDINLAGLDINEDLLKKILDVDFKLWATELEDIKAFYKKFGDDLPIELKKELNNLENRLIKSI